MCGEDGVTYEVARRSRIVAFSIIGVVILALVVFAQRSALKESYFNTVLSSCRDWHDVQKVTWRSLPAFDAQVRYVTVQNIEEKAMVACVARWSQPILGNEIRRISDTELPIGNHIEVSIGGSVFNPPQRIFDAKYVKVRNNSISLGEISK